MHLFTEVKVLFFLLALTTGVTCLELIMTPKYLQRPPMSEVHATCKTASSEAISSCQFRIWYSGKQEGGEIVNIYADSKEPVSIKNPFAADKSYFTVTHVSTNFNYGDCNVKLNNVAGGQLLVGCKLTTASNVTAVKTTALFFTDKFEISLRNNSEEMHVKLGDDVSFELEADRKSKLSKCTMKVNGWYVNVNTSDLATAENPKTVAERYQAWLAGNKCGYKIPHVTESDQRTFFIVAERGKFASAKTINIILKSDLEMVLNKKMKDSKVGDIITATCTTRVRPQQDLVWTWTLGTQAYGDNKIIPYNIAFWWWPWDTTVFSDSRRIKLAEGDRNKNISCSLGMLSGEARYDQTTSMKLSFQAPPAEPPVTAATPTKPTTKVTTTKEPNSPSSSAEIPKVNKEIQTVSPLKDEFAGTAEVETSTEVKLKTWHLSITPAEFGTITRRETRTVLCKADLGTKLTECGFSIDTKDKENYFNMTMGSVTGAEAKLGPFSVKYRGLGLDKGECGIELKPTDEYNDEPFLVGCRARTEHGGWKYNYTHILDSTWNPDRIKLKTTPRLPFLLPSSSLTLRCDAYDANTQLKKCNFTLPGENQVDIDQDYQPSPPHNLTYVGNGLDRGHCGVFIPNIDTLDTINTNSITCDIESRYKKKAIYFTREIRIIVTVPPVGGPTLSVSPSTDPTNLTVTFACVAPPSRPPASIAWYLGDKPVSADKISEEPVDEWRWWRDLESTTQSVKLNLTDNVDLKSLTCVMSHMDFDGTNKSSLKFENAAPEGYPTISVTSGVVKANSTVTFSCVAPPSRPPASIAWYLGDKLVSADKISEEPVNKWRWWRDPETTTKSVTLNLIDSDEGKNITCGMSHVALVGTRNSSRLISFKMATTTTTAATTQATSAVFTKAKPTNIQPEHSVSPINTKAQTKLTAIIIGVLLAILIVIGIIAGGVFTYAKKKACFKEHGSEEVALTPSRVQDSRSAPQKTGKRPLPMQQVQPLRERRPTPPDTHELLPMHVKKVPEEKVEYAEIIRSPDAPPVMVKPKVVPVEEEVEYAVLSWDDRK